MFMNRAEICRDENRKIDYTDASMQALERRIDEVITDVGVRMRMEGSRVINAQAIFNRIRM
jgi:hypothetical protein